MLPCNGCGYRQSIPGNSHIKCSFAWLEASPEMQAAIPVNTSNSPRTRQWFMFPFNYDPVWGPDACPARADEVDPAMMAKPNALAELLSLLR